MLRLSARVAYSGLAGNYFGVKFDTRLVCSLFDLQLKNRKKKICIFPLRQARHYSQRRPNSGKHGERSAVFNVPNILTMSRIAATPFLGYLVCVHSFDAASCLLVCAGLTDWLDGFIAKRYNQVTVLGSFLDPVADKLLVSCLMVCECAAGLLPLPLVALVLAVCVR